MIKGNTYTTIKDAAIALFDLDPDERRLVDELVAKAQSVTNWTDYANFYMSAVGDFYQSRGLTRKEIIALPVWRIAQDLKSRLMVAAGEARAPGRTIAMRSKA